MKRTLLSMALLAGGSAAWLIGESGRTEEGAWTEVAGLPAPTVAYKAATIYAHPQAGPMDEGWLLVGDGKVVAVLDDASDLPPMLPVVDLGDKVVVPGLVAADSSLAGTSNQGDHALGAHRFAVDDFDAYADWNSIVRRGVTTVYLSPARGRLIGGRGAVVKTAGKDRVLRAQSDLRINLTPEIRNTPPFFRPPIPPTAENPIGPARPQPANSLSGAMLSLREQIGGDLDSAHGRAFSAWLSDEDSALRVVARSATEVQAATELAALWEKPLVLQGAQEADKTGTSRPQGTRSVLEIPLFLNAPDLGPNGVADAYDLDLAGGTALVPGDRGRWTWLLEAAAAATGMGLDEREALRGITEMPAWSLGVQSRVGTLSPGKDADFVALSAGPLDPATSVDSVWIDGDLVFSQKEEQVEGGTVLRAGTVWTGSGAPFLGGAEVLLRDGKVVAVGARVPHPEGARIVDAGPDAHITPGFIDAHGSLGMNGRVDSSITIGLMAAGSLWNPTWRSLARAGITTMVPSHSNWGVDGFRTQAVKTAAGVPSEAFVQGRHVVFFDWSGGDHATRQGQFQRSLNAGKKYFDSWEEYRKKRAEWEASSGERESTERVTRESELRQRLAGAVLEEREEEEEEVVEEEEEEVEKEVDPINGLWEATIEHPMIPEPINVNVRISHDGPRAILLLSSPDFPEEPGEEVEATWEPPRLIFQEESEIGTISIVGEVDSPDHMNVSVDAAGMISLEFEAFRIEVGESGDAAVVSRKRVKKDDGPQPPAVDPRREGWRALFEQRAVAVVKVQRQDEAERAIALFQKHELPFHLTGFGSGLGLEQTLADEGIGVVVPASLLSREKGRDQVTAAYFQEAGVRTAFQSGTAGGGARLLPRRIAMAVRHGLGAEQALESLTSGAADMLGLQGSVGRLNPGLDGDLILHSGPPFDLRSEILGVWVNGEEVPE